MQETAVNTKLAELDAEEAAAEAEEARLAARQLEQEDLRKEPVWVRARMRARAGTASRAVPEGCAVHGHRLRLAVLRMASCLGHQEGSRCARRLPGARMARGPAFCGCGTADTAGGASSIAGNTINISFVSTSASRTCRPGWTSSLEKLCAGGSGAARRPRKSGPHKRLRWPVSVQYVTCM